MAAGWFDLATGLLGGLALFLFGLDQLARGLQGAVGEGVRMLLSRLTANRLLGALTGALVTALLNSSSVTTVLLVGFVTAGVMTFAQSLSVILGANVGSTVTAQILAFDIHRWALILIAGGFATRFSLRGEKSRYLGTTVLGLGLVFFGMGTMGDAVEPLRSYPPFLETMAHMEVPILGILVGAAFTAIVQSSAATMGIAIAMAAGGLVTLPAGIALALGANIGTCATALLASIGKPREAQRAAVAHIVFNVVGVLIWVGLIDLLAALAIGISPAHPELHGAARRAAEVPRQLANAHTIFNVVNTVLFLGLTGPFARLVERLVPDRPAPGGIRPVYLDAALLGTPGIALEAVRREVGHLGEVVEGMVRQSAPGPRGTGPLAPAEIARLEAGADDLHESILTYLGQLRRQPLTAVQGDRFIRLMQAATHLEGIGDLAGTELPGLEKKFHDRAVHPTPETGALLLELDLAVRDALHDAVHAIAGDVPSAARAVLARKPAIQGLLDRIAAREAERLGVDEPRRPEVFRLEMEVVERLKRIYSLTRRIARTVAG
ncbi:MAG: Na/Pi cotransporter family protein [Acidobacteriota bacterium]